MVWRATIAQSIGGRPVQEDSGGFAFDSAGHFGYAVVADGLGGHGSGEIASAAAVAAAASVWARESETPERIDPAAFIGEVVALSHQRVVTINSETGTDAKTTICCAFFSDDRVVVGNVGDSRAYLLARGQLRRLSRDHSVLEMLLAQGEITEDQMRGHRDANRLTQAIGAPETPRAFLAPEEKMPRGTSILLCSDGVWQSLAAPQLAQAASGPVEDLVAAAATAGGASGDNATAVLVRREGGVLRRFAHKLRPGSSPP
jgi:serine/threonine protein phosphatase PrpC